MNEDELGTRSRSRGAGADQLWAEASARLQTHREAAQRSRWGGVEEATIARFVLGRATLEERRRVAQAQQEYPELAGRIQAVRSALRIEGPPVDSRPPLSLAQIEKVVNDPEAEAIAISEARRWLECDCSRSAAWLIRTDFLRKCSFQPQHRAAFRDRLDVLYRATHGLWVFVRTYQRSYCICNPPSSPFQSLPSSGADSPDRGAIAEAKEQRARDKATLAEYKATLAGFLEAIAFYLFDCCRLSYEQIAQELNRQIAAKAEEIAKQPYTAAKIQDLIHTVRENPVAPNVPRSMIAALRQQDLSHEQIAQELNRQIAAKAEAIAKEPYTAAKVQDLVNSVRAD